MNLVKKIRDFFYLSIRQIHLEIINTKSVRKLGVKLRMLSSWLAFANIPFIFTVFLCEKNLERQRQSDSPQTVTNCRARHLKPDLQLAAKTRDATRLPGFFELARRSCVKTVGKSWSRVANGRHKTTPIG